LYGGRRGRARMDLQLPIQSVSITTDRCCELESRSERSVQHYVIKFVSDL